MNGRRVSKLRISYRTTQHADAITATWNRLRTRAYLHRAQVQPRHCIGSVQRSSTTDSTASGMLLLLLLLLLPWSLVVVLLVALLPLFVA